MTIFAHANCYLCGTASKWWQVERCAKENDEGFVCTEHEGHVDPCKFNPFFRCIRFKAPDGNEYH